MSENATFIFVCSNVIFAFSVKKGKKSERKMKGEEVDLIRSNTSKGIDKLAYY